MAKQVSTKKEIISFRDVKEGEEFVSMVTSERYRKGSPREGCNAQAVYEKRDVLIDDKLEVVVERAPVED
ncbi:MAG: hypothetical protein NTV62_02290 [Candidatus Gribaldobacteria bacterium]|nr:hypothetical protein [Candidatus Gribaldobacteria bacterium]